MSDVPVQEIGVVVIVAGALYFLWRHFFGAPRSKPIPPSFVPLSSLKKKHPPSRP